MSGGGGGEGVRTGVISSDGRLLVDQGAFDDGVLRALSSLDETARACLLLRTLLDLPYRDISLALGIPEGTAMSHVHRARGILRRKLSVSRGAGDAGTTKNETARRPQRGRS